MLLENYCEHDCLVICVIHVQIFADRESERVSYNITVCLFFHFHNVDIFNVEICTVDPRYLDFDYLVISYAPTNDKAGAVKVLELLKRIKMMK